MTTLLLRYAEIGIKSEPVRKRFEKQLKDNILSMLAFDGVEAIVSRKGARFYVETSDKEKAVNAIRRVFGVASVSAAEMCSSDLEEICRFAAEYSKGRLSEGQSFAVDARREGTHPYTSIDVAREAGSAIFLANEHLGIKVNLTSPDVRFYIEVRDNLAFFFSEIIPCHAGLPIGTQGKVVADVDDDRGLVSAWLVMKRGCRVLFCGTGDLESLRRYDPDIRECNDKNIKYALACVQGRSLNDLKGFDASAYELPVFFPTIAMKDEEVKEIADGIRRGF